jgi:hypothetical protein
MSPLRSSSPRASRRSVLRGAALGAGATFLGPLVGRLVSEARGQTTARQNLFVLTGGNGWGHQGLSRETPLLTPPAVRSATDWDLPEVLAPLAPMKDRLTILRGLYNPHDVNLHGNGWATLSVQGGDGATPGGISIDRLVGLELGKDDPFPSIAVGVPPRKDASPVSTSADGPRRPFPAIGQPVTAFANLFGTATGGPAEARAALAREKTLLNGMIADVNRTRAGLAGAEKAKLDQLLDSYRSLERQLTERDNILSRRAPPPAPKLGELSGIRKELVRGHVEVVAAAMAFGLTHVAHLSIMGRDAHNIGWETLGFGGDAHESLAHLSGYTVERATMAYQAIIGFEAGEIAAVFAKLKELSAGDATLADRTVALWVNSGGGKHHNGNDNHAAILVGNAGGKLKAGQYQSLPWRKNSISGVFLAVAQAMGSKATVFGDPDHSKGSLPGLLA